MKQIAKTKCRYIYYTFKYHYYKLNTYTSGVRFEKKYTLLFIAEMAFIYKNIIVLNILKWSGNVPVTTSDADRTSIYHYRFYYYSWVWEQIKVLSPKLINIFFFF